MGKCKVEPAKKKNRAQPRVIFLTYACCKCIPETYNPWLADSKQPCEETQVTKGRTALSLSLRDHKAPLSSYQSCTAQVINTPDRIESWSLRTHPKSSGPKYGQHVPWAHLLSSPVITAVIGLSFPLVFTGQIKIKKDRSDVCVAYVSTQWIRISLGDDFR